MKDETTALLKEEIQNRLGKKITLGRDCTELSNQILKTTRRTVSSTTLKRFFGIVNGSFKPSKYTLETLAIFLGYEDWDTFQKTTKENHDSPADDNTWTTLKKRIQRVTEGSMTSLKLKTKYDPEKFLLRSNARKKFEAFDASPKTATMFVAPDGYGKSSTILQLVDEYFLAPKAKYKNDIVCLIDGNNFFNLYANNSRIELLNQLLEFRLTSSLSYFFRHNPEFRKGRIWIIIDDVDDIFIEKTQYHKFAENLMRLILTYADNNWTKILLTCRPENLDVFANLSGKNPMFRSCWFNVDFSAEDMSEAINVPVFSEEEIRNVLNKLNFNHSLEFLKIYHDDILEVLQYPNFLSILADVYQQKGDDISKIVLLNSYIEKRVHSLPFRDEKKFLIDQFFELCDWGKETTSVKKELLPDKGHGAGFKELISHGLIYEYMQPNEEIFNHFVYVRFCQNLIFEFLLAGQWLRDKIPDTELIGKMRKFYSGNDSLRCRLMQMVGEILLHYKDYQTIARLHLISEESIDGSITSISQIPRDLVTMSGVIKKSMRYDEDSRQLLIPFLAKTTIGQKLYFEEAFDIDGIMIASGEVLSAYSNRKPPQSDAFTHYMRFFQGFLSLNKEQCNNEYEKMLEIDWKSIHSPIISSYCYNVQIIYASFFNGDHTRHLLKKIFLHADLLRKEKLQSFDDLPEFELSIISALNLCNKYEEIIKLSDYIEDNYDCSLFEGSPFYQYHRLCLSRALLHKTNEEKAMEVFDSIVDIQFPDHMKYYMNINVNLIRIDFLLTRNKQNEAIEMINNIKQLSSLLKFNYFFDKAVKLENQINSTTLTN